MCTHDPIPPHSLPATQVPCPAGVSETLTVVQLPAHQAAEPSRIAQLSSSPTTQAADATTEKQHLY